MLLLAYVLRNLRARFKANLVTTVSIALFVANAVVGIGFYLELRKKLVQDTPTDQLIVLAKGSPNESSSQLGIENARQVSVLEGIKHDGKAPRLARELVSTVYLTDDVTKYADPPVIRGIDDASLVIHRATIIEGAAPARGTMEVLVGATLLRSYPNLRVGSEVALPGGAGRVSGIFTGPYDDELWTPRPALEQHPHRQTSSSLYVVAENDQAVAALVEKLDGKRYDVEATSLRRYNAERGGLAGILSVVLVLLILLSVIVGVATATAMNAAVTARIRELASFAVIGFRRGLLARLVLFESMLLAAAGTALGLAASVPLGWGFTSLGFSGATASTASTAALGGVMLGLLVGLAGGLGPTLKVRRLDVLRSLR